MAHLGHRCYLLADERKTCFGSNCCAVCAWMHMAEGDTNLWCPRRYRPAPTNMSFPCAIRPPWMAVRKAPAGPPEELRSTAALRCLCVMSRPSPEHQSAGHVAPKALLPLLVTSCCAFKQPLPDVQELRCCVIFALPRLRFIQEAPPRPHRDTASPLGMWIAKHTGDGGAPSG